MRNTLYRYIERTAGQRKKMLALLLDPDKYTGKKLLRTIREAHSCKIDFFLIGGSLTGEPIDTMVSTVKKNSRIPVVLYPGNLLQISFHADAILLLSLISGRNPDLLIGNHVLAAPLLHKSKMEIMPTGYILLKGEKTTSVEYISNTLPIPQEKTDIITATALAGQMLGMKLLYLEKGSGATVPVDSEVIRQVRKFTHIPLIVGGGIQSADALSNIYMAGADMAVVGTAVEANMSLISVFSNVRNTFNIRRP